MITTIICLKVSINDLTDIAAYLGKLIENLGGDVVLQVGAGTTALSSITVLVVESLKEKKYVFDSPKISNLFNQYKSNSYSKRALT